MQVLLKFYCLSVKLHKMINLLIANQHAGAAPVAPPTAFTLSYTSSNIYAYLSWTASVFDGGFSSYNIYRDGVLIGINTSSSPTTFVDWNTVLGVSYSYYIKAVDLTGQSTNSNTIGIYIIETTAPKINSFTFSQTSTTYTITSTVSDAGGIDYISAGGGSGGTFNISYGGATSATYSHTWTKLAVQKGTRISFYVNAMDIYGNSSWGWKYSVLIT